MKHPDIHGLFYKLIVLAVLLVIILCINSYLIDTVEAVPIESLWLAVTGLAYVFAAIVLLELVYSRWKRNKADAQIYQRIATMETSMSKLKGDIEDLIALTTKTGPIKSFLISANSLLKEEATITRGEVWIYTPALTTDITARFLKVIASNVAKGVTYYYLLPDVPDLHGDFNNLVAGVCGTNDNSSEQSSECPIAIWLPPALSRPGGITLHVHEGSSQMLTGFATVPHERWGNDFFIRMDQTYASRALHYLQELKAEHESRPLQ